MFDYDKEYGYYYKYHTLSSGQTCMIAFVKFEYDRRIDYYVCFAIANKKKQLREWFHEEGSGNLDTETTGKCGMEGLIWAFQQVEKAISYFHSDRSSKDRFLIVSGSTPRRYRIYKHFLKRLGFYEQNRQGEGIAMMRKI